MTVALVIIRLLYVAVLLSAAEDDVVNSFDKSEEAGVMQTDSKMASDESVAEGTADDLGERSASSEEKVVETNDSIAIQLYRKLFRHKRAAHIEATKKIVGLNSPEKQHRVVKAIFAKLFSVLVQAKVRLMESSFTPGDAFPTDEILKDAFSTVLENTAFLGDIVLRLPDICHELLNGNDDWKSLTHWAVVFTNDTRIFIDKDAILINMMAQELEIVEKDANYINPYKRETKVSQMAEQELLEALAKQKQKQDKKEKKEQKKKLKGPRMSRVEL